jgi:hypothetical protein
MLLAEALTHSSVIGALTPSHERLALIGTLIVESYVHERFAKDCKFIRSGALVVKDQVNLAACTFSSPAGWSGWECTRQAFPEQDVEADLHKDKAQVEYLRTHMACCDRSSLAYLCVRFGLHDYVRVSSAEISQSISDFVSRVVFHDETPHASPSLIEAWAPKVLGDTYLACLGAIVMDSDTSQVENILSRHFDVCEKFHNCVRATVVREISDVDNTEIPLPLTRDGAVFCRVCKKWFNGAQQFAEHERGKSHLKAVRRAVSLSGSGVTHDQESVIPDIPVGFGKVPKKDAVEHNLASIDIDDQVCTRVSLSPSPDAADVDGSVSRLCNRRSVYSSPIWWRDPRSGSWHYGWAVPSGSVDNNSG